MDAKLQEVADRLKSKSIANAKAFGVEELEALADEMPAILAVAAEQIPGSVDDIVIAALSPMLVEVVKGLLSKMKSA